MDDETLPSSDEEDDEDYDSQASDSQDDELGMDANDPRSSVQIEEVTEAPSASVSAHAIARMAAWHLSFCGVHPPPPSPPPR